MEPRSSALTSAGASMIMNRILFDLRPQLQDAADADAGPRVPGDAVAGEAPADVRGAGGVGRPEGGVRAPRGRFPPPRGGAAQEGPRAAGVAHQVQQVPAGERIQAQSRS
ncbi:hypothetical protein ON010_g7277 [Phytophthora cinnamomi]|nr:hypothetical protein ON010_g7277 [Phytophthora cinnamomi]